MYNNTKGRNTTASLQLASTAKTRFENFLRHELGVTDATDPEAVVGALRRRYPTTAARLEEEQQGVAVRFNTPQVLPVPAVMDGLGKTAGALKADTVRAGLAADLELVMAHPSNRDFKGALTGWRDAVLAECAAGLDAAVLGADPVQRDRAFHAVRKLGDYARVARMVGLLNPDLAPEYRRLARSLDDASMVLRVRVGEALFRAGFAEGGSVFQVALQDLRRRGEALIASLERFTSPSVEDGDDWGDGEASYGALLQALGSRGQQDLRAFVQPENMSQLLDGLLEKLTQQTQPEFLQELAATAPLELVQLKRLESVAASLLEGKVGGARTSQAASAPLSSFVQALHLFIEAFSRPGAQARMLDLAIPLPFAVAQTGRPDPEGRRTVRELLVERSELALELDALFADPNFDPLDCESLVKFDRVLYDLDRAIDLYLHGSGTLEEMGVEERQAALYGHVLRTLENSGELDLSVCKEGRAPSRELDELSTRLQEHVETLVGLLVPEDFEPPQDELDQFLKEQQALEGDWRALALQLSRPNASRMRLLEVSSGLYDGLEETPRLGREFIEVPPDSRITLRRIAEAVEAGNSPYGKARPTSPPAPPRPPSGGGGTGPSRRGTGTRVVVSSRTAGTRAETKEPELRSIREELAQVQSQVASLQGDLRSLIQALGGQVPGRTSPREPEDTEHQADGAGPSAPAQPPY